MLRYLYAFSFMAIKNPKNMGDPYMADHTVGTAVLTMGDDPGSIGLEICRRTFPPSDGWGLHTAVPYPIAPDVDSVAKLDAAISLSGGWTGRTR